MLCYFCYRAISITLLLNYYTGMMCFGQPNLVIYVRGPWEKKNEYGGRKIWTIFVLLQMTEDINLSIYEKESLIDLLSNNSLEDKSKLSISRLHFWFFIKSECPNISIHSLSPVINISNKHKIYILFHVVTFWFEIKFWKINTILIFFVKFKSS